MDLLLSEEEGREKVTTKDRSWRLGRLRVFELKGGAVVVIDLNRKFKLYPSASNNQRRGVTYSSRSGKGQYHLVPEQP